jgi:hypothetical protein
MTLLINVLNTLPWYTVSNKINVFSETKEKIFQINLEDQNGLDEDLSQVLAIRAEKIAEAKENFFKQVNNQFYF